MEQKKQTEGVDLNTAGQKQAGQGKKDDGCC